MQKMEVVVGSSVESCASDLKLIQQNLKKAKKAVESRDPNNTLDNIEAGCRDMIKYVEEELV